LAVAPPSRHTHAHAEPFLYAVLAGDATLAGLIHQRLRPEFNQGSEYEEDFAFARILHLLTCAVDPQPQVEAALAFWRTVSTGEEPEYALATALLARDHATVRELLSDRLDAQQQRRRKEEQNGSGDPDERLALGRVDLEVGALVTIARHRLNLDLTLSHPLLPGDLVPATWSHVATLPTSAWRNEERYHLYRDQ
jgi:hypothetical protein